VSQEVSVKAAHEALAFDLSVEQALLAHERTLMAWIRTSVSLITFGFTLYKFSQYAHGDEPPGMQNHLLTPREYGMALIATGILIQSLATLQNRRAAKRLRTLSPRAPFPLAVAVSAMISILGIGALVVAALRR
jgi:putative membrane protein